MKNLVDQINTHEYLFLMQIEEPEVNVLHLIIAEAKPSGIKEDIVISDVTIKDTQSIITTNGCSIYVRFKMKDKWNTYI